MLIFELLDQFEGICRRAFFGCAAKLNKTFKANIIEILILIMCIPRKINFLQLGRYGRRGEQRYRQTFRKDFDWLCFNMNLAADRFQFPTLWCITSMKARGQVKEDVQRPRTVRLTLQIPIKAG